KPWTPESRDPNQLMQQSPIDRDPAGRGAAERLSARATEVGIAVRLLEPRLGDFNDDLRAYGTDALRQHLAGQIGPEDRHRLSG
ncbi:MAG: toprim domain-containing protein, partial [Rhodobacteraceae bacterium]|nr:toprim domain-containing protein [Paracoccaceae bacterium]